jgi:crossover junction endodeoxyribonuclease RuvC
MGIDPGLANTGFGVVRVSGSRTRALDAGVVESPSEERLGERLRTIHAAVCELLDWHRPEALALEDLYFNKNVRSAMAVGQARGVVVLAAAEREIPCFDYTPQAVKMSVCGSGAADKVQVQHMVGALLGLATPPAPDHAADALAVAICHAAQSPQMLASAAAAPEGGRQHRRPAVPERAVAR